MAKQIIVLRTNVGPGGDTNVNVLGWYAVTTQKAVPIVNGVSIWSGASGPENAAIAAGTVVEEAYQIQYPSTYSTAQIKADLISKWTARQSAITAQPNPNAYFGIFFDSSTGWSV
jgi:hypothetical protein